MKYLTIILISSICFYSCDEEMNTDDEAEQQSKNKITLVSMSHLVHEYDVVTNKRVETYRLKNNESVLIDREFSEIYSRDDKFRIAYEKVKDTIWAHQYLREKRLIAVNVLKNNFSMNLSGPYPNSWPNVNGDYIDSINVPMPEYLNFSIRSGSPFDEKKGKIQVKLLYKEAFLILDSTITLDGSRSLNFSLKTKDPYDTLRDYKISELLHRRFVN